MSPNYDSMKDTLSHQMAVLEYLCSFARRLGKRAGVHDKSKLHEPEKSIYDEVVPLFKGVEFGSEEYKGVCRKLGPAGKHHKTFNRHHPEFFEHGMRQMTLVDLVEMFCDWCAASERDDSGNIGKGIQIMKEKYGFSEMLAEIFVHTVQTYGMGAQSHMAYRPSMLDGAEPEPPDLESNLKELIAQWRETVSTYQVDDVMKDEAQGYLDCIQELEQLLAGDLSPIERWPESS